MGSNEGNQVEGRRNDTKARGVRADFRERAVVYLRILESVCK